MSAIIASLFLFTDMIHFPLSALGQSKVCRNEQYTFFFHHAL
ncbi:MULTISPECIES: hypothetical protein [Phocaeicola]|nr:hypothetical protein [Phocaeicola vulgatus]